jgi:hypothetical protein
MSKRVRIFAICALVSFSTLSLNAKPAERISVVVGENAPQVEKFAASELCGYLDKLFAVHAQPATVATKGSSAIFLIGSPATNPLIKSFPKLSDQGIVITPMEGARSTIIVGGGSPQATLWAVYELAERWGVRYLLDRDAIPARSKFSIPNERVVMEPIFRVRAHGTTNVDFADSGEGWGFKDFRPLVDQLAKMKYNRLNVGGYAWQPYLAARVDRLRAQPRHGVRYQRGGQRIP